mgnify:CR=1 FL=1
MTKLKICGLRDVDNAVVAAESGADFLGFVFVPGARRQLSIDQAESIIFDYRRRCGEGGPQLVGLFADQLPDEVSRIVGSCGLDMAQLCGSEPIEYWREMSVPIFKQIKVRDGRPTEQAVAEALRLVDGVVSEGHLATLDKYETGSKGGGTGKTFDWRIATEVARIHDFLLAGGLNPHNVGQAIDLASPWGVDVSSGIETNGVKDPEKIVAFADAVRRADRLVEPT